LESHQDACALEATLGPSCTLPKANRPDQTRDVAMTARERRGSGRAAPTGSHAPRHATERRRTAPRASMLQSSSRSGTSGECSFGSPCGGGCPGDIWLARPLINPASSFRSHQGFASFPLIVDPSDVPTTWVMRGPAWNNQPSRGLKCPNRVRASKRPTDAVDALRSSVAM
jgi:hypothetical protein